jgi:hypothetical protein
MAVKRFRIWSIPRAILLDPQGKVISAGLPDQPALEEDGLAATLAKLLPEKSGAAAEGASPDRR